MLQCAKLPGRRRAAFFVAICKVNLTKYAKKTILNLQSELDTVRRGRVLLKTRIQELRKQRKMSQEELAAAVGVTRQTITSLECEKYTASLALAYKIAKLFGLSIEDVFDFSEVE